MSGPCIQVANPRLAELAQQFLANERRIGAAQDLADRYRAELDGPIDERHAELEAAVAAIVAEGDRLLRAIRDTPAMNYADLVVKLRMAAENGELMNAVLFDDADEDEGGVALIAAVIRDAERLAGGAE